VSKFTISDGDITREVRISHGADGLDICLSGHGCSSMEGEAPPIFLEVHEGNVVLYVWADINQDDPTHKINLSGALLSARRE
jgi:hypothetical protein